MTQTKQASNNGKSPLTLTRNGLSVECFFDENGMLARKIERYGSTKSEYAYRYDSAGHLSEVELDGGRFESYAYNHLGQRTGQTRHYERGGEQELRYNDKGQLVRMSMISFSYDKHGALEKRGGFEGDTHYFYNGDTMLDRVIVNEKMEILYEYDASNPLLPARRFRNGTLSTEFTWDGPLRLSVCRDHDLQVDYTCIYDSSGVLDRIHLKRFTPKDTKTGAGSNTITSRDAGRAPGVNVAANTAADTNTGGSADPGTATKPLRKSGTPQYQDNWFDSIRREDRRGDVHDFLSKNGNSVELYCGCDQVGTLKLLTDAKGNMIKETLRDSFGCIYQDSFPGLYMPIGFAGGLEDPDTGLVRFGWRDYDPNVGRFTAPDPAKDTRGDGDLYDYCVDDPVNAKDPTGLWTKETFAESRIRRDSDGEFSSSGGGSGGGQETSGMGGAAAAQGKLLADAGQRVADAGRYTTDAGDGGMWRSTAQELTMELNLSDQDKMIRLVHGNEVLALSREWSVLTEKWSSAVTEKERRAFNDQIGEIKRTMKALTDYENVFSEGFQAEQQQTVQQWQARITTPDNTRKYVALMEEIENAPMEERQQLVQTFFRQLAHDAGMPQTQIRVVDNFATLASVGRAAGAYATEYEIVMDATDYQKEDIFWAEATKNFFHEQGHDLLYKAIATNTMSDYPEDIAKMRLAKGHYAEAALSTYWYGRDYTEQHAGTFEQNGVDVVTEWNNYRRGNK